MKILRKIIVKVMGKNYYLMKTGVKIGKNTRILSEIDSFGSEPYLIEIGENCLISDNTCFMTHDGGISVINNLGYFDKRMDKLGRIKVGNNCFVGKNATIMPGVTIGNNCIIGLGSIVTKNIPDNSVVCGIPAKVIKSIDEYREGIKNIYPTASLTNKEKKVIV